MRLKSVWITEYKNLRNFRIEFNGNSFLDVFVGKNGTGKSNFFEALIEIFRSLYDMRGYSGPMFDYELSYEIESVPVKIERTGKVVRINGLTSKRIDPSLLPANILAYYSGHNSMLEDTTKAYQAALRRIARGGTDVNVNNFIHFDRGYKNLLLTLLIIQPFDEMISQRIRQNLGIHSLGESFAIDLKRPITVSQRYRVDRADEKTRYWGIKGEPLEFVRRLSLCQSDVLSDFGYFERANEKPIYHFDISVAKFGIEFKDFRLDSLFLMLNSIKVLNMVDRLMFRVILENGEQQDISHFSDGQFQSVYLFALMEMFQDRNCITLMDEPDAFLHPEWQYKFLKQTALVSEPAARKNHVLLSTHSPSTVAALEEDRLMAFEKNISGAETKKDDKDNLIKSLSAGLITFSESEARLNINHILKNTSGPILFTEGVSDEMILETAWEKLYQGRDRPFEIQGAFGSGFLRNLLKDPGLYAANPNRIFFSLFDFDTAFADWNQLGTEIQSDPHKCLMKKYQIYESYALLLPVPANPEISKQVLNPRNSQTYEMKSLLTIELLFHGVPGLDGYFVVDIDRTDGFLKFVGDTHKVDFAQNVVPGLSVPAFENLRPIFESILNRL